MPVAGAVASVVIELDIPWIEHLLAATHPLPARLALVGGAVRDLLLHRRHAHPWSGLPDLDLVVDLAWPGDPALPPAHRLALSLQERGDVSSLRLHDQYGTAEMVFQGFALDVASARLETYLYPGANPVVRFDVLEQDLARRDFTINAMAVVFLPPAIVDPAVRAQATLLDPFDGLADLAARRLRFLHAHSVEEDPSRLVRGARYAARLGFQLDAQSLIQVEHTLAAWPWAWTPGEPPNLAPPALATRLRMELDLLLEREPWAEALTHLQAWGGLPLLDAALQGDSLLRWRLHWARRFQVPLMAALLVGAADPLALAERLQVPHRHYRLIQQWLRLRQECAAIGAAEAWPPSRWCALLEAPGLSPQAVALALVSGVGPRRPLLRWLLRWRQVRSPISAAALLAQGVPRGPELGLMLQEHRASALDAEPWDETTQPCKTSCPP